MVIQAQTPFEASLEILRIAWAYDYRNAYHPRGILAREYVYFNPIRCRFYFSDRELQTHAHRRHLIKLYLAVDAGEAMRIAASRHPFSLIFLGAVAFRKMYDFREYFEVVRKRPEWFLAK